MHDGQGIGVEATHRYTLPVAILQVIFILKVSTKSLPLTSPLAMDMRRKNLLPKRANLQL